MARIFTDEEIRKVLNPSADSFFKRILSSRPKLPSPTAGLIYSACLWVPSVGSLWCSLNTKTGVDFGENVFKGFMELHTARFTKRKHQSGEAHDLSYNDRVRKERFYLESTADENTSNSSRVLRLDDETLDRSTSRATYSVRLYWNSKRCSIQYHEETKLFIVRGDAKYEFVSSTDKEFKDGDKTLAARVNKIWDELLRKGSEKYVSPMFDAIVRQGDDGRQDSPGRLSGHIENSQGELL